MLGNHSMKKLRRLATPVSH